MNAAAIHDLTFSGDLPPCRVLRRYHKTTCMVPRFQRYRWLISAASVDGAFVCAIAWGSYSTRYPRESMESERWESSAKVRGENGPRGDKGGDKGTRYLSPRIAAICMLSLYLPGALPD